jgi:hypothetical protein
VLASPSSLRPHIFEQRLLLSSNLLRYIPSVAIAAASKAWIPSRGAIGSFLFDESTALLAITTLIRLVQLTLYLLGLDLAAISHARSPTRISKLSYCNNAADSCYITHSPLYQAFYLTLSAITHNRSGSPSLSHLFCLHHQYSFYTVVPTFGRQPTTVRLGARLPPPSRHTHQLYCSPSYNSPLKNLQQSFATLERLMQ